MRDETTNAIKQLTHGKNAAKKLTQSIKTIRTIWGATWVKRRNGTWFIGDSEA